MADIAIAGTIFASNRAAAARNGTTYIVMAYTAMTHIVMAYIVMTTQMYRLHVVDELAAALPHSRSQVELELDIRDV